MKKDWGRKQQILFIVLISLGIAVRYLVMLIGHNYDFDSYCIVGEIAAGFRSVYAETTRYNYAPLFLCLQGLLYKIAQIWPDHWMVIYRCLIVTVLTAADLGITAFIADRYSGKQALVFFLNPVSIIITGYHNQFDNIAVLFALISILFFNKEEGFHKKDAGFLLFFSLSLITKHILFLMPVFILLMKNVPLKKRLIYAFIPPLIFLASFIPFALSGNEALQGIIKNVFLYRSFNNMPLLIIPFKILQFPAALRFIVYVVIMIALAWHIRKMEYEPVLLIYFIAMVTFSSAIANQYLAIPMVSLCVLNVRPWDKVYMIMTGILLFLNESGFNLVSDIQAAMPGTLIEKLAGYYAYGGYVVSVWILLFALIHLHKSFHKTQMQINN